MKYLSIVFILLITPIFMGCPFFGKITIGDPMPELLDAPIVTPLSGVFNAPITIYCDQTYPQFAVFESKVINIWLWYTIDGSNPAISPTTTKVIKDDFKLTFTTPGQYSLRIQAHADFYARMPSDITTYTYTVQ